LIRTKTDLLSINSNLTEKLNHLVKTIDYIHPKDGVGLYVSPRSSQLIHFPFPVSLKVKAGNTFDSRDLLYFIHSVITYHILSLSRNTIRLFKAKGEELIEVKTADFPLHYEETYDYSKTIRGTSFGDNSLKGFERDKSNLQNIRFKDFLRKADQLLGKYQNSILPLVVSGDTKEISAFLNVTHYRKNIIGPVDGNYNFEPDFHLGSLAWKEVQNYFRNQNDVLLASLRELVGKEMIATGIEDILRAAKEGKNICK
jgi:hypothetical protein